MQLGLQPKHYGCRMSICELSGKDKQNGSLLSSLTRNDEKNGAPHSDIGVYMSKETSPEVLEFMKNYMNFGNNSAHDVQISANDLAKLSDDDVSSILDSMPRRKETLNQYEQRIMDFLEKEKSERLSKAKAIKRQKDLERVYNSGKRFD